MSYVYQSFESGLWTVGFYKPDGTFEPESDHGRPEEAAERVAWLNGGQAQPTAQERARYAVRGHYHDATGHENTLCQCPEPGRYAPAPYNPEGDEPRLDCPVCHGKHFEQAGIENCAADHEADYPYDRKPTEG